MIFRLALALTVLLATFSTPAATRAQLPFAYLAPRPDARFVSTSTTIVVRSAHLLQPRTIVATTFSVAGSASGVHTGRVRLAPDGRTVIFTPQRPFLAGERVHVTIRPGMRTVAGHALEGMEWWFTTSASTCSAPSRGPSDWRQGCAGPRPDRLPERAGAPTVPTSAPPAARAPAYATVPLDFPTITTTLLSPEVADGSLFLANFTWATTDTRPYLLILDNSGEPVYYRRFTPGTIVADFRKQPNGLLTYFDGGAGLYQAMDRTYTVVDSFQTGNGYETDLHDLQLLPNGHALLMSYDPQTVDMSRIVPGGHPTATVIGLIIQELDTVKNVVFEWRSWDHFAITDTVAALTTETVDYVHGNAVELDADGNLLLSSRHLNEITKINRETGDVMWRWGGKRNQFVFSNDEPFVYQHDVRRLPNGNITLFDNRTLETPEYSRAVEYQLDEERKVATLVREYRNTPDTYSQAMGNAQRLPNGNTLVGWGSAVTPAVTEFKPDGSKVFELALAPREVSYRAFRFPWQAEPRTIPTLIARTGITSTTLFYSWNGATDIAAYRVYGGTTPAATTLITTQEKTGFETSTTLSPPPEMCYFRVLPVDTQGRETRYSNTVFTNRPSCDGHTLYLPLVRP